MSTIQQLVTDLSVLQSESRRKNVEVKQACERAQASLKAYPSTQQISEIDKRDTKAALLRPFLLACKTGNPKLAVISVSAIHKLIMGGCIDKDALTELLDALTEGTHLAMDIQLRILQCLPTLMQKNSNCFGGELVTKILTLCASLTSNNKTTVVINTASATLQQLFSSVFDRAKVENYSEGDIHEVRLDEDTHVSIDDLSFENYNIFKDLCNIIENNDTEFFKGRLKIKPISVLEIVESIVANHSKLFDQHQELMYLVRARVIPSSLRILNNPLRSFPFTARAMRNIQVLISTQLKNLVVESEMVISFLNHILLSDEGNSDGEGLHWEKVLTLEVLLGFFSDFEISKSIFLTYDNDPKKKNVIQEMLAIINTYLSHNSFLIGESIEPVASATEENNAQALNGNHLLSKASSGMKINVLDHLEKTEAPHSIPRTYPVYLASKILIAYADGTAKFVSHISSRVDPSNLESDVEFINAFIESNFKEIYSLFSKFLYTKMDNETFHSLIRSLQKYIHTAGLLGLSELRDSLLQMLSATIVVTSNKANTKSENNEHQSSLQEQGKNLFALGESLVESISSSLQSNNENNIAGVSGATFINSRKVTCLRALVNLAISLGSTLQGSWRIIWVTLQWCDYYINGTDEFSGPASRTVKGSKDYVSHPSPEKNNFESLEKRLLESIREYPEESFQQPMIYLMELLDISIDPEKKSPELDSIKTCPFNATYFLSKIQKICEMNLDKFFIEEDETWNSVCSYFIKIGSERSLNYNLRNFITEIFNKITRDLASTGFASKETRINKMTSVKSLEALIGFLNSIFELGLPSELLVLNCETEMQLLISKNLHELIDNYDSYYQDSWHLVFEILSTPFKNKSPEKSEDNVLKEKKRLLIESSFDTLKLILDEFLSSLPSGQLKLLIDTLYYFCSQKYDLNISFSAVSYFWLIGDTLKVHILEFKSTDFSPDRTLSGQAELIDYLESDQSDSLMFYTSLDVYLLSSLVKSSTDSRARVRDGSIQTLFQIIDVHGHLLLPMWNNIYEAVILNFLKIRPDLTAGEHDIKEWMGSMDLILAGLVSLYSKFLMVFEADNFKEWQGLIESFKDLIKHKLADLNVKVFKSYRDLLVPFENLDQKSGKNFDRVKHLLFEFWIDVPIEYEFLDSKYQESVVNLMECFQPLYHVLSTDLDLDQATAIINLLTRCARYPVLPSRSSDDIRPSKLQSIVLKNLSIIDSKDSSIQSQVIQQLSNMTVYPFGMRNRIEQKLSNSLSAKLNLSSFIALSHHSVDLLDDKLSKLSDFSILINDRGILKLLRSLLELVTSKTEGIKNGENKLWVKANIILSKVISRLVQENSSQLSNNDIWVMILSAVKVCFVGHGEIQEQENLHQYNELIGPVLPALLEKAPDNLALIEDFTQELYKNSFLYEHAEEDQVIVESHSQTKGSLIDSLSRFDFKASFGSTKPIEIYPNRTTRFMCLQELVKYSKKPENPSLNSNCLRLLLTRTAFCLRRFIADEQLLYKCPIHKIQEDEIMVILRGLQDIFSLEATPHAVPDFAKLFHLLVKLIPFASRVDGLSQVLESLLHLY